MPDFRDGAVAAFSGMENSLMSLRSVTLLLARLEQDQTVARQPDGTCNVTFGSWDEVNAQAFLILNIEERVVALLNEFQACLEVWKTGVNHAEG